VRCLLLLSKTICLVKLYHYINRLTINAGVLLLYIMINDSTITNCFSLLNFVVINCLVTFCKSSLFDSYLSGVFLNDGSKESLYKFFILVFMNFLFSFKGARFTASEKLYT